ncbi:MAG TPA: hypothetical protein VHC90_04910 [Bryobacteraceae bacterium]|nr:hypothetical protein [Bryobacteraceae bacterium]
MSLRGAISFLGEEWARLNRMIEALEREAETHHKRHAEPVQPHRPSGSQAVQPHPSLFSPSHPETARRWSL